MKGDEVMSRSVAKRLEVQSPGLIADRLRKAESTITRVEALGAKYRERARRNLRGEKGAWMDFAREVEAALTPVQGKGVGE